MIAARRLLLDRARSLRWWVLGAVALVVSTTALYPTVEGNESFEQLADDLPEAVVSLFGIDSAIGLTSAPGYLQARLFSTLLPVVLVIFGIGLGTRAVAGGEEDGTLELTLAQPISRRRLVTERYASSAVLIGVLTTVTTVVLVVSAAAVGALDGVSVPGLVVACAAGGALALLHMSIAFAAGGATGRRAVAVGVASTVAVAGYLLHGLLGVTDALHALRFATPWHWYLGRNMLAHGPAFDALAAPLVVSGLLMLFGISCFDRRDLR
ncbi:MAG: ABC transporter permease subunit [Acidimicrobiales bacterium]